MADTRRKFDQDFQGARGAAGPRDRQAECTGGPGPGVNEVTPATPS
jgi:hypothetical protein